MHASCVPLPSPSALADENGHGTHVAGSALGAAPVTLGTWGETAASGPLNAAWRSDLATGAAPGARLAFYDLGSSGSNLTLPWDLGSDYYG